MVLPCFAAMLHVARVASDIHGHALAVLGNHPGAAANLQLDLTVESDVTEVEHEHRPHAEDVERRRDGGAGRLGVARAAMRGRAEPRELPGLEIERADSGSSGELGRIQQFLLLPDRVVDPLHGVGTSR